MYGAAVYIAIVKGYSHCKQTEGWDGWLDQVNLNLQPTINARGLSSDEVYHRGTLCGLSYFSMESDGPVIILCRGGAFRI